VNCALQRVSGLCVAEFSRDYWERKPHVSFRAQVDREFERLLCTTDIESYLGRGIELDNLALVKRGDFVAPESCDQVAREYGEGATIVVARAHSRFASVNALARELSRCFATTVGANAYLTPPASLGFPVHYDTHDVLIVQTEGEKRWRIWGAAIVLPFEEEHHAVPSGTIEALARVPPQIDVVLRPGDSVYIPRGFLHAAQTEASHSLHVSLGVVAQPRRDLMLREVQRLLDGCASADRAVRAFEAVAAIRDAVAVLSRMGSRSSFEEVHEDVARDSHRCVG